ncbi:hypothetical protein QE152_g39878 [Popillia japonica]|uniref:Uncharacterized protein n=1 Tax=Popillia japonica TaxID=7064 RepID=A0AAW1HSW2_POPJA
MTGTGAYYERHTYYFYAISKRNTIEFNMLMSPNTCALIKLVQRILLVGVDVFRILMRHSCKANISSFC